MIFLFCSILSKTKNNNQKNIGLTICLFLSRWVVLFKTWLFFSIESEHLFMLTYFETK